ncbi:MULTISPECIES: helix-turn-helix domain-containing protein [Bacillus]|uniref:HTH cro/C1-type domain-containing protein n=2 Tax=Bacillus TaxID=1386 RepID=A0A0M4FP91_9BACI|nr:MULTISPECIES: XRE family transcriptional regulator [Bacillus]ALC80647.1 hypothetical protein AM592_02890 [Bacillus gobiensis]MBP1079532.1 transcriptional regulator with XRE-family HTH domain [Bacillus capparidis]MED1094934.1 XRE family transcriptional regulator [Bacillus capparidis]
MEDIQLKIAANLKRLRKERNYTFDQLSALTGVSKGMLAQIERGTSSPTVSTLWKIANGLKVSFSSILEDEMKKATLVKKEDQPCVKSSDDNYHVYPYFSFDQNKKFEIYFIDLLPGCRHESDGHHSGVEEYVLVSEGTVHITIGENEYVISDGDALSFEANGPHCYENRGGKKASVFHFIYYS